MIFILIFIATSISSFSQNNCNYVLKKINKADKLILNGKYSKAEFILKKIEDKCNQSYHLNVIGDSYFTINEFKSALNVYVKSFETSNYEPTLFSTENFLTLLFKFGNYEYLNLVTSKIDSNYLKSESIINLIRDNTKALANLKDSIEFNPVFLSINSADSDDYFPALSADGRVLIFTHRNFGSKFSDEDFFISRNDGINWSTPTNLGEKVNSDFREGALSISLDGKYLYYASCNRPDSHGGCDLYYSTLIKNNYWTNSINLGNILNSKFWDSQPSISADGNKLFFVSNRNGGYGGSDIWVSRKINGIWSSPENLGNEINSSSDEYTPFLHADNETFYFASKKSGGLGGFDMYVAKIDESFNISDIKNLGYPINTNYDESGIFVLADGKTAFYNSNKNGNLDIYKFKLTEFNKSKDVSLVNVQLIDSISRKGIINNVLISLDDESQLSINSDSNGELSFPTKPSSNFLITVISKKYDFFSNEYSLNPNDSVINIQIVLNRLKIGNKIKLQNIYFDFDEFSLTEESYTQIKKIVDYLKINNSLSIEIGGHTDNLGTREYNYNLSLNRAKAVFNSLIQNGIDSRRISYFGYGYDYPISTKNDDQSRTLNRRTEIKITGIEN